MTTDYRTALKNTAALVASMGGEEKADALRALRHSAAKRAELAKSLRASRGYSAPEAKALVADLYVITKGYGFACAECDHDTCVSIRQTTAEVCAA